MIFFNDDDKAAYAANPNNPNHINNILTLGRHNIMKVLFNNFENNNSECIERWLLPAAPRPKFQIDQTLCLKDREN